MAEPEAPRASRLSKYLALQLGISRREADEFIEQGRVTLNGAAARLGARVTPEDSVLVNGKPIKATAKLEYLAFHKPVGYVSSRRAQGDNPTIYALLPSRYHTLKPVGRLDQGSSGLLLLTNDGDFAYRMTHPKFYKTKVYYVQLDRPLEPLHQQMISDHGVQLEDGVSRFTVSQLDSDTQQRVAAGGAAPNLSSRSEGERKLGADQLAGPASAKETYEITMHEGRNRQIRRTFAALGYTVTRLHRTQFGRFSLGNLKPGEYTPLDIAPGE